MNKSTLFTQAHKIARKTVVVVGDYQIAFSFALKEVYKMNNSKLNELLNNDNVNVWELFDSSTVKSELKEIVKTASFEDLKSLIIKFDDHQLFAFMEDFITDGMADNMTEDSYWNVVEEAEL